MVAKKEKPFEIPKTLGACADLIYTLRQERLAQSKIVDSLQEKENLVREHLINTLPKSQAGGISGKIGKVSISLKVVPRVEDWDKFYAYVKKTGDFSLLQRRVGDAAVQERWENKKTVPGVVPFQVVGLSIGKV